MFVKSYGSAVVGIEAITVAVEVNISAGIGLYMVGLPDNAVRESQERIRAAFENCSYKMSGRKVIVNLAPADIRKEGSAYDLPIAVAVLAATEQVDSAPLARYVLMGELSLDGSLLPVRGALPIAIRAQKEGFKGVILPNRMRRRRRSSDRWRFTEPVICARWSDSCAGSIPFRGQRSISKDDSGKMPNGSTSISATSGGWRM